MDWHKLFYWLLTAFAVYLIFEIARKLLGGSLGFEELVIALLVLNIGHSFVLHAKVSKLDAKLSGHLGWHKGKGESH